MFPWNCCQLLNGFVNFLQSESKSFVDEINRESVFQEEVSQEFLFYIKCCGMGAYSKGSSDEANN